MIDSALDLFSSARGVLMLICAALAVVFALIYFEVCRWEREGRTK